jgi:hypothetical protein
MWIRSWRDATSSKAAATFLLVIKAASTRAEPFDKLRAQFDRLRAHLLRRRVTAYDSASGAKAE